MYSVYHNNWNRKNTETQQQQQQQKHTSTHKNLIICLLNPLSLCIRKYMYSVQKLWCKMKRQYGQILWANAHSYTDYTQFLFCIVCCTWRERKPQEKNGHTNSWSQEPYKRRDYHLSQRVWPFRAEWFLGVNFQSHYTQPLRILILTWSLINYCLLCWQGNH